LGDSDAVALTLANAVTVIDEVARLEIVADALSLLEIVTLPDVVRERTPVIEPVELTDMMVVSVGLFETDEEVVGRFDGEADEEVDTVLIDDNEYDADDEKDRCEELVREPEAQAEFVIDAVPDSELEGDADVVLEIESVVVDVIVTRPVRLIVPETLALEQDDSLALRLYVALTLTQDDTDDERDLRAEVDTEPVTVTVALGNDDLLALPLVEGKAVADPVELLLPVILADNDCDEDTEGDKEGAAEAEFVLETLLHALTLADFVRDDENDVSADREPECEATAVLDAKGL
jgi:hypothetical protein